MKNSKAKVRNYYLLKGQARYVLVFMLTSVFTNQLNAQADLSLSSALYSPSNACQLSTSEVVSTVIVNTSGMPFSGTVDLYYSIDNGPVVAQTESIGFMPSPSSFIFSFNVNGDFSSCGIHDVKVWFHEPNDPNNVNDTIIAQVISDCDPIPGNILGPDTVCIGNNSGTLVLSGNSGPVNSWGSSIDNGATWGWLSTTDTFLNYTNLSNQTDLQVLVESPYGLCPSLPTPVYTVYLDQPSIAGVLPSNFSICDNGNNGVIDLNSYNGDVLDWYVSGDGGLTWIAQSNQADTLAYQDYSSTTLVQAVVQNGVCPADTTNALVMTLIQGTQAGILSGPSVVCNFENNGVITASGGNGDVINWIYSIDSGNVWLQTITAPGDSLFNFNNLTTGTMFAAIYQEGNCPVDTTIGHYLTVLPLGVYILPGDTTINENESLQLQAFGGSTFSWWPDFAMDDPNIQNPFVGPLLADITYFVEVTDINGCKDTATIDIKVLKDITSVGVPNLITPNADGYNDVLQIENLESFAQNQMTVFNIYGQIVYEAQPYNNDWDGTYNGNQLPDGTYFYLLRLNDPLQSEPIQGAFTITGVD
ncbi:gliding motility-associated C-terminal domain-containing protein [Paracrocinitomix mangrovi]|uniref:gliding motility-associated C-terminal domain-containing protein n=1 Tax=Paracrocinitomix mangrovi TaxID=2862509 RepID=UPI001C8CF9EB|nr:gliding motility-associated C-terminal domain-containing protein [Paracrocinitomix mangrovi]UKN01755.1 gliding motility-associated C-terminal domain-containing protein [Paracrocinitomix mangrovi]